MAFVCSALCVWSGDRGGASFVRRIRLVYGWGQDFSTCLTDAGLADAKCAHCCGQHRSKLRVRDSDDNESLDGMAVGAGTAVASHGIGGGVSDGDMEKLSGSDVITGGIRRYYDGEFMDRVGPKLKLIAKPGIGVDNIDLDAATERGILVCNTPEAPTESTAGAHCRLVDGGRQAGDGRGYAVAGRVGHRAGGYAGHGVAGQYLGHRRLRTHRPPGGGDVRAGDQDAGDGL